MNKYPPSIVAAGVAYLAVAATATASDTIPTNFNGYGSTVNGFQDFFDGSVPLTNYTEIDGGVAATTAGASGVFTEASGVMTINGGNGDPNKLLYSGHTYDPNTQNVLAEIEVTNLGTNNDNWRGGVATESSASSGAGINLLFRQPGDNGSGNHLNFLDDQVAWGPSINAAGGGDSWAPNTYYWLRLTNNGTSQTGEIWPADGTTPESSALTATWGEGGRSGLAGLVANSGGNGTFNVNYLLIQSPGLSTITAGTSAVPEPGTWVAAGGLLLLAAGDFRRRMRA